MDIRDILKSFDQLSEGESTVHKAGPGGYGNKHGSEDVTDQYGKPIGRMSLGKLGAQNEPKRGKGRPPNPDKAQSYDSSALSKAMGMGKAPKPTGKPSVKHSLKEYFNELDDALNEAGLAVQPIPATPQQKQQQAVASKPSFMIKDPANPTTPSITTSDPAVVDAAKNGTMTMQKPGASPTSAGATPATGSGSQIAPMEEEGGNWIKGAIKHPGAFTKKAKSHGMTPSQFRDKVLAHKEDYPAKTEKQAQLAKTLSKMHESQGESPYTLELISSEEQDDPEGWSTMNVSTFKVLKNGKEIGTAEYDDYFGNLDIDINGKRQQLKYDSNHPLLKMAKHAVEEPINIAQHGVKEAEAPQHFAQSSPLSTANRGVLEGKGDFSQAIEQLSGWDEVSPDEPGTRQYDFDDDEGGYYAQGTVVQDLKTGQIKIEFKDDGEYGGHEINDTFNSIGDAMNALRNITTRRSKSGKAQNFDTLGSKTLAGPDDVYKTDRAGKIGTLTKSRMGGMKASTQHTMRGGPKGVLPEGKKGVNPFAKKDTKKKPDDDGDGVPDWADKKPGKDDNEGKKKGAAPKKGVNPFAKKTEKKKVKEGMEHNLQAARLEGKSHALRKMPYNCTHDDMEEARHYHDGFKEGLDECYGQMPILGRTAVDEMGSEVGTMAGYGATGLGEMDKTSYMKQQAIKTPGDTFKAFGQTMHDNNVLDEFAFEAFDNQLSALLESEEKVSEGMTVSISKGQHGSPDSVSVSAQDGEADQLLSIIKSAGLGLFGGEEKGFNAPEGGAGAHGGISVVDDHDGMMALMKRLSGGEMSAEHDHEGEQGHSHEGEEEPCNECGYMESQCQCGGDKEVVDEVESEDQMAYKVAEDNPPDNGSANSTNATMGNAAANASLAKADAGEEEEPVAEADEEDDKEDDEKDFFHNPNVPADKQLKAPPKEVNVAESFANLYKKLAFLSEESTEKEDEKAEKAGKKVAKDIEYDEGHKGKDDDEAERAGKKVTKDIEYDDKKDKKVDESYANSADDTFEADIDFMTKVISGGLNGQKSTGQTTVPVISGQGKRTGIDGKKDIKESMLNESVNDWKRLAGISK